MRWLLGFLAACSDFAPPSALVHPQIIAVRASPSGLAPGETARLDALVAGPTGVLAPPLGWKILHAPDGTVLAGDLLEAGADGEVVLGLEADGLEAEKRVAIGAHRDNPVLAPITADGEPVGAELRVARGATVMLAAEAPSVSWYCTFGEIARFRDPSTELAVGEEAADGTLVLVARDDEGGVTWQIIKIFAE